MIPAGSPGNPSPSAGGTKFRCREWLEPQTRDTDGRKPSSTPPGFPFFPAVGKAQQEAGEKKIQTAKGTSRKTLGKQSRFSSVVRMLPGGGKVGAGISGIFLRAEVPWCSSPGWRKGGHRYLLALVPCVPWIVHALEGPSVGRSSAPLLLPGSLWGKDWELCKGWRCPHKPHPVGTELTTPSFTGIMES